MTILTTEVKHGIIVDCCTQPKDGMRVLVREEGSEEVIAEWDYDYSWDEMDACADAVERT